MYRLTVQYHFDAAHALRGYHGKCENLHGHRWQVELAVKAEDLDEIGMAVDFAVLKRALKDVLDGYDHRCLNETPPFDQMNPTTENLARVIYYACQERLSPIIVSAVRVWESPDASATFAVED